jgi:hypothetical protein
MSSAWTAVLRLTRPSYRCSIERPSIRPSARLRPEALNTRSPARAGSLKRVKTCGSMRLGRAALVTARYFASGNFRHLRERRSNMIWG